MTIPPRIELIRQASFGEGSMTVEVCSSDDAFTNDGHEIDLPAPPSLWKGLFVETGVAIRKSNFPGNSSETLGMRWTSLPFKPRRGQEIESIGLREKLAAGQTNFTRSELDLFYQVVGEKKRALEVRDDSFIKVSESLYFQPDDTRDGPAPCGDFLSCANPELTAGEAVEVTLSEVVLSDDPGAPKRSFDDSKPVKGSRSSQLVFDSATTSFSTYGGEELDDLGERAQWRTGYGRLSSSVQINCSAPLASGWVVTCDGRLHAVQMTHQLWLRVVSLSLMQTSAS